MSKQKHIKPLLAVLGAGESGVGTALLAQAKGYDVFVSDKSEIKEEYKQILVENSISFEEKTHSEQKISTANFVMKSPGIPDEIPLVVNLKKRGIPVISEIEFAAKYTKAIIIGITGSNGKTTTTMLAYHILKNAGINVGMAGNIGNSFAKLVLCDNHDVYVLELSSFQLDGIIDFVPHIAIITNITPDHLDRYNHKFENYVASKFQITENQSENQYLIYDADDEVIKNWLENNSVRAKLFPFSIQKKLKKGAYIDQEKMIINYKTKKEIMSIETLALQGKHNTKNALAAAMTASLQKVRKGSIRSSLQDFEGVEHRLESVLKINGVQYINDSKATNINSTYYALESIKKPIVWIVGGVDKGNDYWEIMELVRSKVKAIVCLGVENEKIINTFGGVIDELVEVTSMSEAVDNAYKLSEKGDVVLLSPACASFDLFTSYEDRGFQFKEAVRKL